MTKHIHLYLFTVIFLLVWSLLLASSYSYTVSIEQEKTIELAKKEARTTFNKDIAFRAWATSHGGVYVPISEKTQPNRYLEHIPDRDITTPEGKKLTLMNPAYMTRQVMSEYERIYGIKGFITSLNPINPLNTPDFWQKSALQELEKTGETESYAVTTNGNNTTIRLMKSIIVQQGCLECHNKHGYTLGYQRGGIGVNVPLNSYLALEKTTVNTARASHALIWIIGVILSFSFMVWGRKGINNEQRYRKELIHSNEQLQIALNEVKTLRGIIPICSYCKKIRNDEGAWDILEAYFCKHSDAAFSHGICPDCYQEQMEAIAHNR